MINAIQENEGKARSKWAEFAFRRSETNLAPRAKLVSVAIERGQSVALKLIDKLGGGNDS